MQIKSVLLLAIFLKTVILLKISHELASDYHTNDQIEERIDELIHQNQQYTKKTCQSSSLYKYLQIGTPSNTTLNAVVVCNIHAREIIAAEICLKWIQNLKKQSTVMTNYFTRVFYIANPNRQRFIEHEQQCIRKNQNNVDGNRNFPTDFNHWNADQSNQTYGGKEPLDQPLSQCLNELFTSEQTHLYMDVHSGQSNRVYYQQGFNDQQEVKVIGKANEEIFDGQLTVTTLAKGGQTINGHIFADIKVRLNVPFSILMETYQGPPNQGCFLQFNPTGSAKSKTIDRYVNMLNFMFSQVNDIL